MFGGEGSSSNDCLNCKCNRCGEEGHLSRDCSLPYHVDLCKNGCGLYHSTQDCMKNGQQSEESRSRRRTKQTYDNAYRRFNSPGGRSYSFGKDERGRKYRSFKSPGGRNYKSYWEESGSRPQQDNYQGSSRRSNKTIVDQESNDTTVGINNLHKSNLSLLACL